MNTARKQLPRIEPQASPALPSTQFRYLRGGFVPQITEESFTKIPPAKRRRSLSRRMLQTFSAGRRSSGRSRNPRFGF